MNNTNTLTTENTETIMTKELYLQLVKEFKESANNKDFKPSWGKNWNGDKEKQNGTFVFEHYIFYALLRNKNPEITTHDPLSESYHDALSNLKYLYESMKKIMPSLSKELFMEILNKLNK